MRTPGERTSGAWTGGCAIHPDGGDETDRTAGDSYTATPHNTQGATSSDTLQSPRLPDPERKTSPQWPRKCWQAHGAMAMSERTD